jgi:hypothetical protein
MKDSMISKWTTRIMLFAISMTVLTFCVNSQTEEEVYQPSLNAQPVRPVWQEAEKMAHEWDQGAYVEEVRVNIAIPNTMAKSYAIDFRIKSDNKEKEILYVTCYYGSCTSKEYSIPLELNWKCTPINLDDFTLESRSALMIALNEFEKTLIFTDHSMIFLTLRRHDPTCLGDRIVWSFQLRDAFAIENTHIVIDANTEEVLER